MRRALACSALLAIPLVYEINTSAAPVDDSASYPPVVQRFLDAADAPLTGYRALRRLEAQNGHLDGPAWMDVWTEADGDGFRYEIVGAGGSAYVRDRVFMQALRTEQSMWGGANRGAITPDNYTFLDKGADEAGLACVALTPRRKDVLLVRGSIFLRPEDGDLVRIEGTLSKTPSFWTRRVDVVRRYERIAGVRVPVYMQSVANVLIAGRSTFTMTYQYETVNGNAVAGH
jgi:hypothetical protein